MRALFTCYPTLSHFLPLTPIARALADAGHDVAVGTPRSLSPTVQAAGFRWIDAGVDDDDPEMAELLAQRSRLRGPEHFRFTHEHLFAGIRPRILVPDLLALAESWLPDLIVHDSQELGGMIAAELLNIPHVHVSVLAAGGHRPRVSALREAPLARLRASYGLPDQPTQELIDRYLLLAPFPPSLRTLGSPVPRTAHHIRALPADSANAALPGWIDRLGSRRLLYVTLGTIQSGLRGSEVFSQVLAGLHDLDIEVVLTVGPDLDPAIFGAQPDHIHLERFLPLGALLSYCSVVLFHGGSGTLSHIVAHGLPMVTLPLGADQPENAARCAELGASHTLDRESLTPERVREAVLDVLRTPSYRQSAERLRDECNALPGPDFAVVLLERLARDKEPIFAAA